MASPFSFTCAGCGEVHEGLPDITYPAPDFWAGHGEAPDTGNLLTEDFCMIGGRDFFIRVVLQMPIHGTQEALGWGVWVSQSERNFRDYADMFEATPPRVTQGYLANALVGYPDTINLQVQVTWREGGLRPLVSLHPCDNPAYADASSGLTPDRAAALASRALHATPPH